MLMPYMPPLSHQAILHGAMRANSEKVSLHRLLGNELRKYAKAAIVNDPSARSVNLDRSPSRRKVVLGSPLPDSNRDNAIIVQQGKPQFYGDQEFDFEADSLQKRLLRYFQDHLHLEKPNRLLQEAEANRKVVFARLEREGTLGLHAANREIASLVKDFSLGELRLLNRVIVSPSPSQELGEVEILKLIVSKLEAGRGEDLIKYLARRLALEQTRKPMGQGAAGMIDNPNLLAIGVMWTNPEAPLWLMPSAGVIALLRRYTGNKMSPATYNATIRNHRLRRIPDDILTEFLSVRRKDEECILLRKEFENAMGISLTVVRPGPKAKKAKGRS